MNDGSQQEEREAKLGIDALNKRLLLAKNVAWLLGGVVAVIVGINAAIAISWQQMTDDFLKDGDVVFLRIVGPEGETAAPDQMGILTADTKNLRPVDGGNAYLTTEAVFTWKLERFSN